MIREPGDRPEKMKPLVPSGVTGGVHDMQTETLSKPLSQTTDTVTAILVSALLGAAVLFMAGFASPEALHAATHDARHATGFPCH